MTTGAVFDSCLVNFDGEHADFVRVTRPVAAKEHICCECRMPIRKGEQHEKASGKWDGEMSTSRTCVVCVRVRDSLCPDGYVYGGLWEAINNEYGSRWDDDDSDEDDEDWLIGPRLSDRVSEAAKEKR